MGVRGYVWGGWGVMGGSKCVWGLRDNGDRGHGGGNEGKWGGLGVRGGRLGGMGGSGEIGGAIEKEWRN